MVYMGYTNLYPSGKRLPPAEVVRFRETMYGLVIGEHKNPLPGTFEKDTGRHMVFNGQISGASNAQYVFLLVQLPDTILAYRWFFVKRPEFCGWFNELTFRLINNSLYDKSISTGIDLDHTFGGDGL